MESRLDVQTLSLFARARYPNSDLKMKPGQSASISIKLDQIDNAIVIPSISTVKEIGRDITYIYENGKAKEVEITTGMRTASSVEVTSGLSVGDTLLTTGVMQLSHRHAGANYTDGTKQRRIRMKRARRQADL